MSQPTLSVAQPNSYSEITALGAYRPTEIVDNETICQWIDSSDEWIQQRTGIATRHRADKDTSVVMMAVEAGKEAIEKAGLTASDIGIVIVSTVTFPYATPSAAALVAAELGCNEIPAFDISAACAGYCYGIAQADGLVRSGVAKHVLVIGVEKLSDYIDNTERTISFILGDGAGAAVVSASETPGIAESVWGSDGKRWDAVGMDMSLLDARDALMSAYVDGDTTAATESKKWPTLRQDGPAVFRWAVWQMAKKAQEALDTAGIKAEDLAAFVPHQANARIIDEMAKQLKLPETVVIARDIKTAGNTSAASVPLAMHRLLEENPDLSGGYALQIGFGAGLVYGAQVVRMP